VDYNPDSVELVELLPHEGCWCAKASSPRRYSYRFNLWRTFISLAAMGPNIEHQQRTGKGMFAEHPTEGDKSLRDMYEKLNERTVAALIDHDWISMAKEQSQWCGLCTAVPFCF